jgi:PAS domain S-box-containing protein
MRRQAPARTHPERRAADAGPRRRTPDPPETRATTAAPDDHEELRRQLQEAQDTLHAIRSGAVDALVVHTPDGERVFTLETADQPYRMMVERMQQGAATLTADGLVLFANPSFAALLRSAPESVVGRPFAELFHAEDAATVRAVVERARDKACTLTTRLGPAGGNAPVYVAASPIRMFPAEVCAIVTDLTERRRVQELEETLGHFQVLADSSPVPIWVTDPNGVMLLVNRAYCEFFGVTAEAVQPRAGCRWCTPRTGVLRPGLRRPCGSGPPSARDAGEAEDGEWRWITSYGTP